MMPVTQTVELEALSGAEIAKLLTDLAPSVKLAGSPDAQKGGTFVLLGPAGELPRVEEVLHKLDVGGGDGAGAVVYRVYTLRYIGGMTLIDFLKKANSTVEAFLGPEQY